MYLYETLAKKARVNWNEDVSQNMYMNISFQANVIIDDGNK